MAMDISRPTEIEVLSGIVNRQTRPLFESLFRYDEREGEPAQAASANHLSIKHNGWPGRSSDSHPPGAPTLPVCRDRVGGKHVVLLNVQSEARRTCVIGLEAPLGPLNDEDIQLGEWAAYGAWTRTDGHVACFDGVQIIQVKWNTDQTEISI
ncbi:hypothetical protein V501_02406 [Pseudogymnoascus sp. VKM F-4519 (FW-2642)]|nr:hypothetical protein V501_02406 [Pseudogymnoascus sp. VKM F-4519 (FW-2642)]